MTTKPVVVQLDAIDGGVTALKATITKIDERLTALEGQLQPMITTWSGDARTEYLAQKAVWDRAAADMVAALADLTKAVAASHAGYADLHRLITQAWA